MGRIGTAMIAAWAISAGVALAQPRDAPPPGCRWIGDDLGCKDGRGAYRRAGDGEVIGRYAVAPRPKPKPAPRPVAAPVTEVAPSPQDLAENAPATQVAADAADVSANAAASEGFSMEAPAVEAAPPPEVPAAAPAKPKPWWQAFWDWLVGDIMNLLRQLGLAK